MSGTGEEPIEGFPAIGQYELVPSPGEPGYEVSEHIDPDEDYVLPEDPETEEDELEDPDEAEPDDDEPEAEALEAHGEDLAEDEEPIDPDEEDPYGEQDEE
jgi:hypothetical protein